MGPKLRHMFQREGGHTFLIPIGFSISSKEATKLDSRIAENSRDVLLYIRAIQGRTGGNVITLELMGHAAFPLKWEEFPFHRGCSYDVTSILKSGLIAGGRESKGGRQTIFFTSKPVRGQSRRRTQQRLIEESTPPQQMEASSGRRLPDQLG